MYVGSTFSQYARSAPASALCTGAGKASARKGHPRSFAGPIRNPTHQSVHIHLAGAQIEFSLQPPKIERSLAQTESVDRSFILQPLAEPAGFQPAHELTLAPAERGDTLHLAYDEQHERRRFEHGPVGGRDPLCVEGYRPARSDERVRDGIIAVRCALQTFDPAGLH